MLRLVARAAILLALPAILGCGPPSGSSTNTDAPDSPDAESGEPDAGAEDPYAELVAAAEGLRAIEMYGAPADAFLAAEHARALHDWEWLVRCTTPAGFRDSAASALRRYLDIGDRSAAIMGHHTGGAGDRSNAELARQIADQHDIPLLVATLTEMRDSLTAPRPPSPPVIRPLRIDDADASEYRLPGRAGVLARVPGTDRLVAIEQGTAPDGSPAWRVDATPIRLPQFADAPRLQPMAEPNGANDAPVSLRLDRVTRAEDRHVTEWAGRITIIEPYSRRAIGHWRPQTEAGQAISAVRFLVTVADASGRAQSTFEWTADPAVLLGTSGEMPPVDPLLPPDPPSDGAWVDLSGVLLRGATDGGAQVRFTPQAVLFADGSVWTADDARPAISRPNPPREQYGHPNASE